MSVMMSYPTLFDEALDFDESTVPIVVIENRPAYRQFIFDIQNQSEGKDGEVIFSNNGKEIPFKKIDVISDLFNVTLNNKNMLTKLINEVERASSLDVFSESVLELNSAIQKLLIEVTDYLNLDVEFDDILSIKDLSKSYNIRFVEDEGDLVDKLITYLKISMELLGTELFVIHNLKLVFNDEEVEKLYEYLIYNKIPVLIIQSEIVFECNMDYNYIVDSNLCCIY